MEETVVRRTWSVLVEKGKRSDNYNLFLSRARKLFELKCSFEIVEKMGILNWCRKQEWVSQGIKVKRYISMRLINWSHAKGSVIPYDVILYIYIFIFVDKTSIYKSRQQVKLRTSRKIKVHPLNGKLNWNTFYRPLIIAYHLSFVVIPCIPHPFN